MYTLYGILHSQNVLLKDLHVLLWENTVEPDQNTFIKRRTLFIALQFVLLSGLMLLWITPFQKSSGSHWKNSVFTSW